jgi:hypothetical protein
MGTSADVVAQLEFAIQTTRANTEGWNMIMGAM